MEIIKLEIKYRQLTSYDLCGEDVVKRVFVGKYDNIGDAIAAGNELLDNVLWKTFIPFDRKYGRHFFAGHFNCLVAGHNNEGVSFNLWIEHYEHRANIDKVIETAKSAVQSLREYIKNNEEE